MFKRNIKNYNILFILTIVGFVGVVLSAIIVPESLQGYGGITTAIMLSLLGYHIYFYGKELKILKKEASEDAHTKK